MEAKGSTENCTSFMDDIPKSATSLFSTDTIYTACSLEFCPSKPNFWVCGLYQTVQLNEPQSVEDLESPKTERLGKCLLFEQKQSIRTAPRGGSDAHQSKLDCKQLQQIDGPAILDQRWTQDPDEPILITADAQGFLNSFVLTDDSVSYRRIFKLQDSGSSQLRTIEKYSCAKDTLCLALDISDKVQRTSDLKVVTSLSNGEIVLMDLSSSNHRLEEKSRWHGHDFEPWTCGFDYWQPSTILTGGDDCKLKIWDTRSDTTQPIFTYKQFEGGVTAVRSHHLREHIYAVGSYDAHLRIFDKRYITKPVFDYDVGGGIWRLKWHPTQVNHLLVAAMHNGFAVMNVPESESNENHIRVHTQFNEHDSLAYGADWGEEQRSETQETSTIVGSCSFYDHLMHLWAFES
ncbi:WD40-repeat-containing domain protein [Melampsora americana]|nr:WD40-repeat-containing domain protein [Melampsora americana]